MEAPLQGILYQQMVHSWGAFGCLFLSILLHKSFITSHTVLETSYEGKVSSSAKMNDEINFH